VLDSFPIKNDQQIRKIKPTPSKQVPYPIFGEKGASLIVSYAGTKTFYFRYTNHEGTQRRMKLGSFPSLKLSEVRKKIRKLRVRVDDGEDPHREKKQKRLEAKSRQIHTVRDLWEDYRKRHGEKKKSANFELSIWKTHLEKEFATLDAREFNRDAILNFLDEARVTKSPNLANKCQAILTRLAKHGIDRRVYAVNPAVQLGTKPKENSRTRVLSEKHLAEFWTALNSEETLQKSKVSLLVAEALKLTLLTLCRRSETAKAKWSEINIDDKLWVLPSDRTKNGKEHAIPLSDQALSVLTKARELTKGDRVYVFKSPSDLRRTGATILTGEKLAHKRFIVSKLLNHSDKGNVSSIFSVYDRNDRLSEKTRVLKDWGLFVETGDYYTKSSPFEPFKNPRASSIAAEIDIKPST